MIEASVARANETKAGAAVKTEPPRGLAALSKASGRALLIERAWPPIVAAVAVAILFLAVSWLGAWLFAPRVLKIAGVVLFALGFLLALAPLLRLRWPAARDIAARLDRDSGAAHRPATSLADNLANPDDPVTRALWAAHQARLARSVRALRVAPPAPRMAERDPYALRFGVAMMAFAAAVAAGPELYGRLAAAFDWRQGSPALAADAGGRIDAWIDPPPYAGRPPVVIDVASGAPQAMKAFEDSVLIVRGEPGAVETKVEGAIAPVDDKTKPAGRAPVERRWTLEGDGEATIWRGGTKAADVVFSVIPAGTPTIALTDEPQANLSGSLTLAYRIEDRYGLTGARANFALPPDPAKRRPRSLVEPPQAGLETPTSANGTGEAHSTLDLSEHPWAGARVTMTLSATSVSGKTGKSAPVEVTLPQRPFHNPLARALIEERRDLVLDPDSAPQRVDAALTGLLVAPVLFDTPANVYLGLRQARSALEGSRADADLKDVAELLWRMALQIEDGDSTQAQRDLRAAEEALREALKRGASDDEIRKLMQNLREAAQRFAAEMAMKAERNGDQTSQESNRQVESLDKLMDRMEESARNGAREEAEAMLDQLQNMFENMQSAESEESPAERALQKQIDELGRLVQDQQALRDETFRSDQRDQERRRGHRRPAPDDQNHAQTDDDGQPELGQGDQAVEPDEDGAGSDGQKLSDRQKELSDRLAEMQRMLKSLGMKGEKGFDDAETDMNEAEGDLKGQQGQSGQGRVGRSGKGAAVDAQGRALQALRDGAEGMRKQMNGQGRNGKGGYAARRMRPGDQQGDDPLGRGREGDRGRDDGVLREMGSVAERARKVMEELRHRLADPNRPVEECDYLERLMKRD
jgi:uncharacterized protein (TIGR02302 family)